MFSSAAAAAPQIAVRLRWLALATLMQLAACGSSPPVRLHTLLPSELPTANTTAGNRVAVIVLLAAINVPAQVDQPQWLVRLPDDTLALLEQDRWAGPLRDELRSALLEALVARWGVTDARTAALASPPAPAASAVAAAAQPPAWRAVWQITVDVSRFELAAGREARLDSRWSATSGLTGAPTASCSSVLREPVADGSTPALAQGQRRAVARLADEIGQQLQALQRGDAARCPGAAAG